jgi:hypothetical protein
MVKLQKSIVSNIKMEFTLITSHEGSTLQDNMETMQVIYIHPEYLIHMGCENVDEYIKSIVHVTLDVDYSLVFQEVSKNKYTTVNGMVVFRHPRTCRSAIISFHSEHILVNHPQKHNYQVCCVKVHNIRWQENDMISEWLEEVQIKLKLNEIEHKTTKDKDGMFYISLRIKDIPVYDKVKEQLKLLKCRLGTNIAFQSGTNRSICIPKSLIYTSPLAALDTNEWCIYDCRLKIVDSSKAFRQRFNVLNSDEKLTQVFERILTYTQLNATMYVLTESTKKEFNTLSEHALTYTTDHSIVDISICVLKVRMFSILHVHTEE